MKIRVKRPFVYQVDARTTVRLPVGEHDLSREIAEKVLRFGKAEMVVEKKAPANKSRGKAAENKARVVKPTKRGGRKRAKPKS